MPTSSDTMYTEDVFKITIRFTLVHTVLFRIILILTILAVAFLYSIEAYLHISAYLNYVFVILPGGYPVV